MRKGEGNKSNWFRLVGCGSRSVCPDLIGKPCRLREKSGEVGWEEKSPSRKAKKKKRKMKKENEKKRRDETI
jgi:hypothetical protein